MYSRSKRRLASRSGSMALGEEGRDPADHLLDERNEHVEQGRRLRLPVVGVIPDDRIRRRALLAVLRDRGHEELVLAVRHHAFEHERGDVRGCDRDAHAVHIDAVSLEIALGHELGAVGEFGRRSPLEGGAVLSEGGHGQKECDREEVSHAHWGLPWLTWWRSECSAKRHCRQSRVGVQLAKGSTWNIGGVYTKPKSFPDIFEVDSGDGDPRPHLS